MNKIILTGNLVRDPELRTTQSGVAVCSFTIATNRRFKNPDGTGITDFFRITVWRQQAESCAKFLSKGKKVLVSGEFQPSEYTAKDGTKKTSLEVQADEVEFLSPKDEATSAPTEEKKRRPGSKAEDYFTDIDPNTLPF